MAAAVATSRVGRCPAKKAVLSAAATSSPMRAMPNSRLAATR